MHSAVLISNKIITKPVCSHYDKIVLHSII